MWEFLSELWFEFIGACVRWPFFGGNRSLKDLLNGENNSFINSIIGFFFTVFLIIILLRIIF